MNNSDIRAHSDPLFNKLKILKFNDLFKYNVCNFIHQYNTNKLPASFNGMFSLMRESNDRGGRDSFYNFKIVPPKSRSLNSFPRVVFLPIWNSLSSVHQSTGSHKLFKSNLKETLLGDCENFVTCDNLLCEECRNVIM